MLDVDVEKERISLGIKQFTDDPFDGGALDKLKKGAIVTCTVSAIVDGGVEVTVGEGLIGFIRKNELSRDRSEQRPDRFAAGDKVDAKITQIDSAARRLTLSVKAREVADEKRAMAEYGSSNSGASLGDILGAAIREKQDAKESTGTPAKKAVAKKKPVEKEAAKETKADEAAAGDEEAAKKPAKKKAPAKAAKTKDKPAKAKKTTKSAAKAPSKAAEKTPDETADTEGAEQKAEC